jgi:hypothetical protein
MPKRVDPAIKERAVRMFAEHQSDYPSATALTEAVAKKLGGSGDSATVPCLHQPVLVDLQVRQQVGEADPGQVVAGGGKPLGVLGGGPYPPSGVHQPSRSLSWFAGGGAARQGVAPLFDRARGSCSGTPVIPLATAAVLPTRRCGWMGGLLPGAAPRPRR